MISYDLNFGREAGQALRQADGTKHEQRRRVVLRKFVSFCSERGVDPDQPSLREVAGFVWEHIEKNQSANSIDVLVSHLRVGYRRVGLSMLTPAEEEAFRRIRKVWKEDHGREVQQSVPITATTLRRWKQHLSSASADPVLLYAILATGHAGLLRAGELVRRERRTDPGFVVDDVRWATDFKSFVLRLGITKTGREHGGECVTITVSKAVRAMARYFNTARLWDKPTAPLYPPEVTTSWILGRIRELANAAGEAPLYYTAHGLRAGGATDLVARGITYPLLKSAGRWKSDACLRYFRSEEAVSSVVATLLDEAWEARSAQATALSGEVGGQSMSRGEKQS